MNRQDMNDAYLRQRITDILEEHLKMDKSTAYMGGRKKYKKKRKYKKKYKGGELYDYDDMDYGGIIVGGDYDVPFKQKYAYSGGAKDPKKVMAGKCGARKNKYFKFMQGFRKANKNKNWTPQEMMTNGAKAWKRYKKDH